LLQLATADLDQPTRDRFEGDLGQRLRCGLEARGLDPEFSEILSNQLSQQAGGMTAAQLEALLDGAALASVAQRKSEEEFVDSAGQVREIQRMMQAFAGELSKLDESLELLSAYVRRMRTPVRATRDSTGLLH